MSRARDFKVGVFVLAGLLFSGLVIFLIGDERRLFSSSVEFKTRFSDVQGLKAGAPIRMGGIDIGHVSEVGYGDDPKDTTVYVGLDIVRQEAGRIKTDSVARVVTKGLLGDKMLEITKGRAAEAVPAGAEVRAEEPDDMLGKVTGMASKADVALENIQKVSESFADEKLHRDLRETMASINAVARHVAEGEGYPHRLLTDKSEADRISRTLANLDRLSAELTLTLGEVRSVVARVKTGPGFAHELVYGEGLNESVAQLGRAANEVTETLKGIRGSDSLAHDVVYGGKGDGAAALANVTAITADLRSIVADMKAGKGTMGALLVDPSVYEDMKAILGNVQRNDVLRALVRYSIKEDEKKPAVEVVPGRRP